MKYVRWFNFGIILMLAVVGATDIYEKLVQREAIEHRLLTPGVGENANIQNRINMLVQIYDASSGYTKELARELIVAEGQPQENVLPVQQRAIVEEMYWRAPKTLSIRVHDNVKVEDKVIMKEK